MQSVLKPEDLILWKDFKNSSSEAFSLLYSTYFPILITYGKRLGADPMAVQDAVHDLFLDLWRMRENLSDSVSIQFYLCRSLRRRLHIQAKMLLPILEESPERQPQTECFESALIREEAAQYACLFLDKMLEVLSRREKEVVLLKYYKNNSVREVANLLAIKEQTVRNLMHRAMLKLRKQSFNASSLYV
ncbi:RNA polymerase sigma factor [Arundinibacter roseus]|uniref:Sigma-70 family RNA polymerase sigma factor n=1 Tax=Arundinibacter roseus TaxID=2070510 RepID=A0A4R4KBM4_9BACT|nr:sigma-70 family RNA polymerase sigma factor [Arundinibacter roseus]TDB65210.1 sigma-70 family RNA polymerase sigma factor [Arundinibacter roseus]